MISLVFSSLSDLPEPHRARVVTGRSDRVLSYLCPSMRTSWPRTCRPVPASDTPTPERRRRACSPAAAPGRKRRVKTPKPVHATRLIRGSTPRTRTPRYRRSMRTPLEQTNDALVRELAANGASAVVQRHLEPKNLILGAEPPDRRRFQRAHGGAPAVQRHRDAAERRARGSGPVRRCSRVNAAMYVNGGDRARLVAHSAAGPATPTEPFYSRRGRA